MTKTTIGLVPGYTRRLPVSLQYRTPSTLLVSWAVEGSAVSSSHSSAMYHSQQGSYSTLSMDTTTSNHYSFTGLDACSPYVACVNIAGTPSLTCLSAITGMELELTGLQMMDCKTF